MLFRAVGVCILSLHLSANYSISETFLLQQTGRNSVIGRVEFVNSGSDETLVDIARRYDLGYDEIVKANPRVNRWVPERGEKVILPRQFVLPAAPRDGIVINLAEQRLYYFPQVSPNTEHLVVTTFPISIGRVGWDIRLGKTSIKEKVRNPTWYPPKSIREEHAREGEDLPEFVPGGSPDNPLGAYALYLGLSGYLIHGTETRKAFGIGMRVTHGCIRLYPEDIVELFTTVEVGTPVYIVDQPMKVGWNEGELLLEVHSPLPEDMNSSPLSAEMAFETLTQEAGGLVFFDGNLVAEVIQNGNGIPVSIAQTKSSLPPARGFEKRKGMD